MKLVPDEFKVPDLLTTERFRLRPITVHDVVKDYDAVMTNRAHLWSLFGDCWGWRGDAWPFENVAFPGRDISWHEWDVLL